MAYFDCIVGGSGKGNTLVVTCADDLAGATITCTNGTKTYTKTCPSTSPYEVTFYGLAADTWTVSTTVDGNTYTTTVVVADIEAELGGFNWKTWVDLSENYTSSDFTDLDDLLSDETAIRELMTIHACVDYLAGIAAASADVEQIIENDYCAKWINLRDYALDTLYANTIIKGYMDTAGKYGYGEWALVGQVPKMSSNGTPYGTVSASSYYSLAASSEPFRAFDGDGTTQWRSNDEVPAWIQYQFTEAVNVRAVQILSSTSTRFLIQYSDDGITFTDAGSEIVDTSHTSFISNIGDMGSHTYWRLRVLDGATRINVATLQFYAWAPKGNVPVMTSNTAPYGTVVYSSVLSATGVVSYGAFDQTFDDAWTASSNTDGWVGYKFTNPVCVKSIRAIMPGQRFKNYKIEASNTGDTNDWTTLKTGLNEDSSATMKIFDIDIENTSYYLYYRFYIVDVYSGRLSVASLQFYGRELSVSVPVMSGNTTPYGEVFGNLLATGAPAWKLFDGTTANDSYTQFNDCSQGLARCGYDFGRPIVVKFIKGINRVKTSTRSVKRYKIVGSNDGSTWNDVTETLTNSNNTAGATFVSTSISNTSSYKQYALVPLESLDSSTPYEVHVGEFQFYGFDYSEKEFEEGTNKKWLYDHGVELETFTYGGNSSYKVLAENDSEAIHLKTSNGASGVYGAYAKVSNFDFEPYDLLRLKIGNALSTTSSNNNGRCAQIAIFTVGTTTQIANLPIYRSNSLLPYNYSLDVSSVDSSYDIQVFDANNAAAESTISELWLE